jgi:hypothetical protein
MRAAYAPYKCPIFTAGYAGCSCAMAFCRALRRRSDWLARNAVSLSARLASSDANKTSAYVHTMGPGLRWQPAASGASLPRLRPPCLLPPPSRIYPPSGAVAGRDQEEDRLAGICEAQAQFLARGQRARRSGTTSIQKSGLKWFALGIASAMRWRPPSTVNHSFAPSLDGSPPSRG